MSEEKDMNDQRPVKRQPSLLERAADMFGLDPAKHAPTIDVSQLPSEPERKAKKAKPAAEVPQPEILPPDAPAPAVEAAPAAKASPRASKSRNWSKLAQAGDSSTTSPGWAMRAARRTAALSISLSSTAMCGRNRSANMWPASPMV